MIYSCSSPASLSDMAYASLSWHWPWETVRQPPNQWLFGHMHASQEPDAQAFRATNPHTTLQQVTLHSEMIVHKQTEICACSYTRQKSCWELESAMMGIIAHLTHSVILKAYSVTAGSSDASDSGSQASEEGAPTEQSEREQIKRDVLMGHLLSLATQGTASSLPSHALPALAEALCNKGLMPKWVQWSLTHQPALFNTAFDRLFSKVQPSCCHCCTLSCMHFVST